MTVAPIVCAVRVSRPPERAFTLFATRMSSWWPSGKTVGKNPHADIVLEPRPGGRWFERDAEGHETQWGRVLAWEPPARLLLGWQLGAGFAFDPALLTEVEITFAPAEGGGTLVTLEHRDLHRLAADQVEKIRGGWPARLADFAGFDAAHA